MNSSSTIMFETIGVVDEGSTGRLWLNRPEQLNAISLQMLNELARAAQWFNERPEIRVVVVGGRGRAFSAGADLAGFPSVEDEGLRAAADAGRIMADAVEGMKAVTIARVKGWCVGGCLVLAAACDLRVATDKTKFPIPEIDLGIPLAWGGIPRLVREIGPALTKELVMTCREFGADEAKAAGFLNRVVDEQVLDSEVEELAMSIASKPAMPIASTKKHVNAVSSQMAGMAGNWSDADGLVGGLLDAECQAAREEYVKKRIRDR